MGLALDTVGWKRTAGGGGADTDFNDVTVAPGDNATVRNFSQQSVAFLHDITFSYSTAGAAFRVKSPLFHDNTQGIRVYPGETLTRFSLPKETGQMLRPQDNLTIQALSNAASEVVAGANHYWYQDLPGTAARLKNWGDISGLVKNIKPVMVACAEAGTTGQWNSAVITTSEDLLKANTDYALLGFTMDTLEAAIAVYGPDTGNLRAGAPGDVRSDQLQHWFVDISQQHGLPMIPIINSANKNATFVSVLGRTTGATPKIQMILAELSRLV